MEKWIPEIHYIVGDLTSTADPAVKQPRSVLAMKRGWREFAEKRDESRRRLMKEEASPNVK